MNLRQLHAITGKHLWGINTKIRPPKRICKDCGEVEIYNSKEQVWEKEKKNL